MEHRTSKDDLLLPWYKKSTYILIMVIAVSIAVYVAYLLLSSPAQTTQAPPCVGTIYSNPPCP